MVSIDWFIQEFRALNTLAFVPQTNVFPNVPFSIIQPISRGERLGRVICIHGMWRAPQWDTGAPNFQSPGIVMVGDVWRMFSPCPLQNSLFFIFPWKYLKKSSVGRFERIRLIIFFPWICLYPHSVDHVPSQSPVHVGSNIVYGGQGLSIRLSTTHIGYRVQFSMFDGQLLWWMVKLSLT